MPKIIEVPVCELLPDAAHPRLMDHPLMNGPEDALDRETDARLALLAEFQNCYKSWDITRDFIGGRYQAPEPMLAVRQETDGLLVVGDGCRRLAALTFASDPEAQRMISDGLVVPVEPGPGRSPALIPPADEPARNPKHPVAVMECYRDMQALRIRRHQHNRSMWSQRAAAADMRRMLGRRDEPPGNNVAVQPPRPGPQRAGDRRECAGTEPDGPDRTKMAPGGEQRTLPPDGRSREATRAPGLPRDRKPRVLRQPAGTAGNAGANGESAGDTQLALRQHPGGRPTRDPESETKAGTRSASWSGS